MLLAVAVVPIAVMLADVHRSKYSSQAGHLIPILKNCVPGSLFGP